jgi:hypothetical protein
MYQCAKGTKIKWKEEKDLTKTVEIKKQRNKSTYRMKLKRIHPNNRTFPDTNRTRLVRRTQNVPSFFDFFAPPLPMSSDPELVASGEAVDGDELTEEQMEELEEKLEIDYQVGEDLKEKVRQVYLCLVFGDLRPRVSGKSILLGRNWPEIAWRVGLRVKGFAGSLLCLDSLELLAATDRIPNHLRHILGHPSCSRLFHRQGSTVRPRYI